MSDLMIFAGNASVDLAHAIARNLNLPLGKAFVGRFSDGETTVEIQENVRGRDVFIVQSTCPPTNDHLMELVLMADALKRASAGRITAVIPYFGYARQDRRPRSARVPITARVVADLLAMVGIDRVLTVDLHAEQIQGFFSIPLDNVYGNPLILEYILQQNYADIVVVSPDMGGVARSRALAKRLNCDLAIIDKRRPRANVSEVMNIIGDIKGKHCLLVDDIVDTAGTLCKAAEALMERGAAEVSAYCVHPVLSGKAIQNIENSALSYIAVTDSIPLSQAAQKSSKIRQITLANLLTETIKRINNEESVSVMFSDFY